MQYATLGNTGLLVSKLCFGTMTFGDGKGLFKASAPLARPGPMNWLKHRLTAASTSCHRSPTDPGS